MSNHIGKAKRVHFTAKNFHHLYQRVLLHIWGHGLKTGEWVMQHNWVVRKNNLSQHPSKPLFFKNYRSSITHYEKDLHSNFVDRFPIFQIEC